MAAPQMDGKDALQQSEAFPLEEIFESDITNEENKSIVAYLRQVKNERDQLPRTVSVREIKEEQQRSEKNGEGKSNSLHQIFVLLDKYKETNLKIHSCATWKEEVIHYVRNVRRYMHMKYNRKVIDGVKYQSANCSVLTKLKRRENLISVFCSSPLCIHLYIYGINYKQVVHYLHVIASHLVDRQEGHSWALYVWIIYLLILLDSLQALDASVSSDLQAIKRVCAARGGMHATGEKHSDVEKHASGEQTDGELTFLTHFYCNAPNPSVSNVCSSHCPQSIYYIIYYLITEVFNQK